MADLAVCVTSSSPPIPDDLITSGEQEGLLVFETFLAPAAAEEEEEMVDTTTSFRVVARANYESKVVIFVFSSLTEEWHSSKSVSWSLLTADSWFSATAQAFIWFFPRYYAHGCIYWVMYLVDKLLVLDICKMVLSTINFQWDQDSPIPDILEMDDDMIGAFCLKGDLSGRTHLCYGAKICTIAATQGYLLFSGRTEEDDTDALYFTLEPKTMLLEKVCWMSRRNFTPKIYTGFPLSLSSPSWHNDKNIERGQGSSGYQHCSDCSGVNMEDIKLQLTAVASISTLAHAADFTFSFLPTPDHWWRWMPLDWRDGRVLAALVPMAKFTTDEGDEGEFVPFPRRDDVTDLAVCDPISRRYVILLAIPGDLITSGEQRDRLFDFNAFLAPATEEEMAGSSFRVVATAQCKIKLFVFVFSSRSEEWRSYQFDSGSIFAADVSSSVLVQADFFLAPRYYAHCRLYWVLKEMDKLLVLDTCEMVFFTIDLERDEHMSNIAILDEAEEDMIGVFSIRTDLDFATRTQLCYTIRQVKADAANGPPLNFDKIIPLPLPMEYMFRIIDAADGYLLLEGRLLDWFECSLEEGRPDTLYFSLEPKTLVLKRICVLERPITAAKIYTGLFDILIRRHPKGAEQDWLSTLV
uniref:DUF1618 domain-containing protein n=1 Tax=Oryza barthii TaxID=65489 RepID=A0A0D3GSA6_9ORYZ